MGVPRLFQFMVKMFGKKCLVRFIGGERFFTVDNLYLDSNPFLHEARQYVYNYGQNKRVIDDFRHLTPKQKRLKVYELYFDSILYTSSIVVPKKVLDIAIDGPAPLAKQAQQRQRRFAAVIDPERKVVCDSDANEITPGTLFMHELTKYVHTAIRKEMNKPHSPWRDIEVRFSPATVAGEGEHKCYSPNTKVFMWSGEIKKIKNIKVGDYVVSENGTKRKVISVVSGTSQMFLIEQKNGDNYKVTEDHIMCFDVADHCRKYYSEKRKAWFIGYFDRETKTYKKKQFSGKKKTAERKCNEFLSHIDPDSKINVKLSDYMNFNKSTKAMMYGYKCTGIQWPEQRVTIDPYILGTWLGDGSSSGQGFCSIDEEIVQAWKDYAETVNCYINKCKGINKIVYNVSGVPGRAKGCNYIKTSLQNYNLIDNKHIPEEYMCNSREIRLQLLAGLIDTDGNLTHEGRMIRFNQGPANYGLFDQVVILSRSLGFKCCVREAQTTYTWKGEKKYSKAKFLTISGHIEDIPTKLPRKKCVPLDAEINIDRLRTAVTVTPIGEGKYVGINVTGSRKFLLADCTVVHNCLNNIRANKNAKEESHCIFGPDGDLIMLTLAAHVPKMFLLRADQYNPGNYDYFDMGMVRKLLVEALYQGPGYTSRKRSLDDITNDFVILGFFVGNDFLPKIQMFMYLEDGLELMISTYASLTAGGTKNALSATTRSGGGKSGILGGSIINHQGFTRFVEELARREHAYILDQTNPRQDRYGKTTKLEAKFDNHTLLKHVKEDSAGKKTFDFQSYRIDYYAKAGVNAEDDDQVKKICLDYLRAIAWVYEYYIVALPSWRDFYAWHYAPLMTDLAQVMRDATEEDLKYIYEFEMEPEGAPLPFVQLLSVLPPPSAKLLPPPFRKLFLSQESPLVKLGYYPEKFEIDLEGKTKEHMGVVLLPFVDIIEIEKAYAPIADKLKNIYIRNSVGRPAVFTYDESYTVRYTSDYGNIQKSHVKKKFV